MNAKARRAVKMGCASPATRRAGGKSVGVTAERPLQAAGEPDARANKSGSTCNRVAPDGAANRGSRRAVAERVYEALTEQGKLGLRCWRYLPNMQKDEALAAIRRAIGEAEPRPRVDPHIKETGCLDPYCRERRDPKKRPARRGGRGK